MKTATISELEREELMAQEFPMEDLETVYGGVEMEEPDGFWTEILIGVLAALTVEIIKWAWDKFWPWIKSHANLVISIIASVIPGGGLILAAKYAAMSNSKREKLWREVYNRYH